MSGDDKPTMGSVLSPTVESIDLTPHLGRLGVLGRMLAQGDARARKLVTDTLQDTHGCVAEAARRLCVGQRTLWRWIKVTPGLQAVLDGSRAARDAS